MDDFDDGDYMDMDGFEWLYVDDDIELADELAEGVLPDPGYIVGYDIVEHDYDDLFNYGDDVEYGEDAYWDTAGPRPVPLRHHRAVHAAETTKAGSKRKRTSEKAPSTSKRQKTSAPVNREVQPVMFMSREARMKSYQKPPPTMHPGEHFALLPDWRERYRDVDGLAASKPMPRSMAKAVYEDDADERQEIKVEEEGEEDEDEGSSWESDGDVMEADIDFDPDQLRTILAQKMAEAGISEDEESSFMQSINDMLSGEGQGEAAAALLEKAQHGGGQKRKADSAVGIEPGSKKGKDSE